MVRDIWLNSSYSSIGKWWAAKKKCVWEFPEISTSKLTGEYKLDIASYSRQTTYLAYLASYYAISSSYLALSDGEYPH